MKTAPWISAAILVAASTGAPALAQMSNGSTTSGQMQPGTMQPSNSMQSAPMQSDTQSNGMSSGAMSSAPATTMSASDTKKIKACQAMSPDAMMKNARCAKLMKMHPEMMPNSPNGG